MAVINKFELASNLPDDDPTVRVAVGWDQLREIRSKNLMTLNRIIAAATVERVNDLNFDYRDRVGEEIEAKVPHLDAACNELGLTLMGVYGWGIHWRQLAPGDIDGGTANAGSHPYGISPDMLRHGVTATDRPRANGYVYGTSIGPNPDINSITAFLQIGNAPGTPGPFIALDHMYEISLTPPT